MLGRRYFSTDDAPRGFRHLGIHFFPAGQYKPFQAATPGTVEAVELKQNEVSSNWQVDLEHALLACFRIVAN